MPKLSKTVAERAEDSAANASDSQFEPVEDGIYVVRLREVTVDEVRNSKDPKLVGAPVWVWVFEMSPEDEEKSTSRFWYRATLAPEGAEYFDFLNNLFAKPFAAFGVPLDTDTDELVGRDIRADIVKVIAEFGKRKGEWVNQIESLLPLTVAGASGEGDDDKYDF